MAEFDYTGLDLVEVPEGAADDLRAMREASYGAPSPYDAAVARVEAATIDVSGLELVDETAPSSTSVDWEAEKSWARQFDPVYRPDGSPFPDEKAALEARSGLGIEDAKILPLSEGGYHLVRAPATDEDRDRLRRLNAELGRGEPGSETTTLGEIGEIPAGTAAGAVGTAGTALQGVSAAFPLARDDLSEERKVALRGKMREAEDALMKGDVETYSRLTRELHQEALVPVTQRGGFQAGQRIRDWGQRTFPAKEGYEDSFGRQVGEGVGSLLTGIGASVVHPGAAMVLFTTLGMGESADRAAQSLSEKHGSAAVDRGEFDEQIARAAILGVGPGMTDQVPVEVLLKRLPVPGARAVGRAVRSFGGERVMRALGRIGAQGVIEAVQEGGQQALQNLIARHVHSPETTIGEGVVPGAGVGGVVGTIAGVGREAVLNLAGRRSRSARGVRSGAAEAVPPPSPEDEASPIPTETIVEGRKVVADAEGRKAANRILTSEGMPPVGTPVRIGIGRKAYEGVVTDAWGEGPEAGITVTEADGTVIDSTLRELLEFGAEIEVLSDAYVEGQPEPDAAPAETADVETTAGTEADTGGWTPPGGVPTLSPRQAEAVTELVKGGMDADRAVAVAAAMPSGDVETTAPVETEETARAPESTETTPASTKTAETTTGRPASETAALPEGDVETTAAVETEPVTVRPPVPAEGEQDAALPERPTPSPDAMVDRTVETTAAPEPEGLTAMERLARRQAQERVATMAPDEARRYLDDLAAAGQRVEGIEIPGEAARPEPSPEAMVDRTVETEDEVEAAPRILVKLDGRPFQSEKTAALAADQREMVNEFRIVPVEGGFGIEVIGDELGTARADRGPAIPPADVETTAPVEAEPSPDRESEGAWWSEEEGDAARAEAERRVGRPFKAERDEGGSWRVVDTRTGERGRDSYTNRQHAIERAQGENSHLVGGEMIRILRPAPTGEAMVDRTVDTEAPVETEDRGPRPELVFRKDGQPFKSARAAEFAARAKKLEGYMPVEVEGGFAIEIANQGAENITRNITAPPQGEQDGQEPGPVAAGGEARADVPPREPGMRPVDEGGAPDGTVEPAAAVPGTEVPAGTEMGGAPDVEPEGGVAPVIVVRRNGEPFKGIGSARAAAKAAGVENYRPVKVEGGYGYEVTAEAPAVTRAREEAAEEREREPVPGAAPPPNQVPGSVPSRPAREVDRPARVITPAGRRVEVQPIVVEARDLIASHDETGRENPTFPSEFQPRDRSRAASQEQIASMAGDLIPELLMPSAQSAEGAPVVGPDRVVESGNARTLAIRRAYDMGMAGDYRQHLVERGYDIEGFDQPVLAQQRITSMTPEERAEFAREANARTTADRGASEIAASDAASVTRDMLDLYRPGDIGSAGNREFVRSFVGGVVPDMERAGMMAADGTLSQTGKQRIENALFDKAYGDAELLGALREDLDSNVKSLGGAMLDAAPEWARMRLAVAEGSADPMVDHTEHIIAAVRMVRKARAEGVKLRELVVQDEMFAGDALDPMGEMWLRSMYADPVKLTRPYGRPRLAEGLTFWAEEGQKKQAGANMFGEVVDEAEISRMMELTRQKIARTEDEGQTETAPQADPLGGAPAEGARSDDEGRGAQRAEQEVRAGAEDGGQRGDREGRGSPEQGLREPGLADDFQPRQLSLFADGGSGAVPAGPAGQAAPAQPRRARGGIAKTDVLALEDVRVGLSHVRTPEDAAHVAAPFRKEPQETLVAVVTGDNDRLVGTVRHSIGSANNVQIDMPLFLGSVAQVPGAKAFYIAHQHPSGKLQLSQADRAVGRSLTDLLRKTDLAYRGSVVVAPGGRGAVFDAPGSDLGHGRQIEVRPAARSATVPVYRRRWVKIAPQSGRTRVGNSTELEKLAREKLPELSGLIFLDNNLNLVGTMALDTAEMARLRGPGGAARDIFEAMAETNATRVAVMARVSDTGSDESPDAAMKALTNMRRFTREMGRVSGGSGADVDAILFAADGRVILHDREELSPGKSFLQRPLLPPQTRTEAGGQYRDETEDYVRSGFDTATPQGHEQAIATLRSRYEADGNEHVLIVDPTSDEVHAGTSGDVGRVSPTSAISEMADDPERGLVSYHTHPNAGALSEGDIGLLVRRPGVRVNAAVSSEGETTAAALTPAGRRFLGDGPEGSARLHRTYRRLAQISIGRTMERVENGELSDAEGTAAYTDAINRALHEVGIIEYATAMPDRSPELVQELTTELRRRLRYEPRSRTVGLLELGPPEPVRRHRNLEGVFGLIERYGRPRPAGPGREGVGGRGDPGQGRRAAPGPLEDVGPTDGDGGGVEAPIRLRLNGEPYKTRQGAVLGARNRKLDAVPVEVPGGWGLRESAEGGAGARPSARAAPFGGDTALEGGPGTAGSRTIAPPDEEIKGPDGTVFQRDGAPAPADRVRIRPTRRFDAERLAIRAEIEALGERAFGKGFNIKLADQILTPEGDRATGAFDPAARIAYIALRDPAEMTGTLHHEGIHYLRRAGAFTRKDGKPTASWRVLEAEAPKWRKKYKIDERYPAGIGEDLLIEESIAEAIDDYAKNRPADVTGKVKLAMDRILAFWRRVGNALRGRGFQTWADVFEGVRAGDFVGPDGQTDAAAMDRYLQTAWHGSPHEFDRFSTEHIGAGEGVQAYGWGLYFAEKKGVADYYRQAVARSADMRYFLRGAADPPDIALEMYLRQILNRAPGTTFEDAKAAAIESVDRGFPEMERRAAEYRRWVADGRPDNRRPADMRIEDRLKDWRGYRDTLQSLESDADIQERRPGATYQVNLAPKESEYLLWDRQMAGQPKPVRQALKGMRRGTREFLTGEEIYRSLSRDLGSDRAASEALLAAGVRGIKYLDQSSRPMRGAMGRARVPLSRESFNYVIFDDSDVAIEEIMLQRGAAGSAAKPPLDPDRKVPVTEAASRYADLKPSATRTRARLDANRDIQGKTFVNEDTGWQIEVTRQGIGKSLTGTGSAVRAEIVANLPDLIRDAVRLEGHGDRRGRSGVVRTHRFYAPLMLDGRLNRVKLTVREFTDETKRQYAVEFAEIGSDVLNVSLGDADDAARPTSAPPDPTITLRSLLSGVKYEDGSDPRWADGMLYQRRLGEFETEPGAEGVDQAMIPGTEPLTEREVLERRMRERDRGRAEQRPLDFGLFGDPEEEQGTLFQRAAAARFGPGSAVASQIADELLPIVDGANSPGSFRFDAMGVRAAHAIPTDIEQERNGLDHLLNTAEFASRGWFKDATAGIAPDAETVDVRFEGTDVPGVGQRVYLPAETVPGGASTETVTVGTEDVFLSDQQEFVYSPKPLREAFGNLYAFYHREQPKRLERAGAAPIDDERIREFTARSYATQAEEKGGVPVIVYSGTNAGYFEEFRPPDERDRERAAVWGSSNIDVAATYAEGERRFLTPENTGRLVPEDIDNYRDSLLGSDAYDPAFDLVWADVAYRHGAEEAGPPPFTGEDWMRVLEESDWNSGIAVSAIRATFEDTVLTQDLAEDLRAGYDQMVGEASAYDTNRSGIYPLVMNLENPLVVDGEGRQWDELHITNISLEAPAKQESSTVLANEIREKLPPRPAGQYFRTGDVAYAAKAAGYDGVIFRDIYDTANGRQHPGDIYLAFESRQVKDLRAEKFDPKSSNIFYQRIPAENREAFEEAASQQFGIDMAGAADAVKKRKIDIQKWGEELGDQLLGPDRKTRAEGIAVMDIEDPKDLNRFLRFLAPPGVWSKKYPRIHKVWRQGVKAEIDQSVYIKRLNREWDEVTKKLSKEEFEQLTGLMFLGDAEARAFTDAELDDFKLNDKVKEAYKGARRFIDKLGRWTEQHERNMKVDLLRQRSRLIRDMAGRRGMAIEAFRELYKERAILKGHMRHGRGNPDVLAAEIVDADQRLHGEMLEDPEYRELAGEADSIEARLENTTVRRRSGYVPHKFFGNWQVLWANEKAAGWNTATGARGDAAEGEVREGDASGMPVWQQVGGEHGYFPSRMAALKAAREFSQGHPDAKILVKPMEFAFPDSKATVLTDAAYTALRQRVSDLMQVTGEELDEVLEGVARPRNRRRFAGFEQYREGMPGFNKNLDRVIRAHIGETVRYTTLDKLKYDAITAMEKEGLQRTRVTQERPELQAAVEAFLRDVNGQKQPVETQVDAVLNRPWATPLRVGLAAGGAAFLAAGGATTSVVAGGLIGSYIGYRVTRSLARGGEFPSRAVTAGMLSDMSHLKLGMVTNLMSAVVNLTQTALNTYPVLGARDASAGFKRMSAAIASNARGKPNSDWKILVKNDINPTFGFGEGTKNQFQKESKLSKLSMLAFTSAEGFNRSIAFLGGMNKAEREGLSRGKAIEAGKRTMERTQFHYGPANKPELLRENFLRVPLQFKNFVAQQLSFAFGLRGKEIPRFLLSMFLVAGTLGIPGLDLLDLLLDEWFDFSPIAAIKEGALAMAAEGELESGLGQLIARGVPGALGVEISGRTGMGEKFLPLQIRDFAGPWASTVKNAARHAQERTGVVDQIRNLSPGLGNPLRALEAAGAGGQVSNPWKRGRPEMTYTPGELITKAVGGRPTREAMEQDWRDIYRRRTERMRLWNRRYVDRAVEALQRGDRRDLIRIMRDAAEAGTPITGSQLRSGLRGMATERAERTLRTLPKSLRGEARELRRGLDRAAPR